MRTRAKILAEFAKDIMNDSWCMCTKLKAVARDGKSTCSICGGIDAYGDSNYRPDKYKKDILNK